MSLLIWRNCRSFTFRYKLLKILYIFYNPLESNRGPLNNLKSYIVYMITFEPFCFQILHIKSIFTDVDFAKVEIIRNLCQDARYEVSLFCQFVLMRTNVCAHRK